MSLDALTDNELRALVRYNIEQIEDAIAWPYANSFAPGHWVKVKKKIAKAIERIDRILAFKRVA